MEKDESTTKYVVDKIIHNKELSDLEQLYKNEGFDYNKFSQINSAVFNKEYLQ